MAIESVKPQVQVSEEPEGFVPFIEEYTELCILFA